MVKTIRKLVEPNLQVVNITLDTSCIVSLLSLKDDQTVASELDALLKIKNAHNDGKLKIWISQKSVNESIQNLENSGNDFVRIKKWISTLRSLEEFAKAKSVWILDVSRFDVDTVLASDDEINEYNQIKEILIGNKTSVKLGDIYDIAILYEHHLQNNELFISLDTKIFRPTVVSQLLNKFDIRIVSPTQAIPILETQHQITF